MPEDVAIDTGGGSPLQGSGPLGFSWPVVLGLGAGVVLLILYMRSRGSGGGITVSRGDIMLADIQNSQDLLRQDVQTTAAATQQGIHSLGSQMAEGFAAAAGERANYYKLISQQFGAGQEAQASYFSNLSDYLTRMESELRGGLDYNSNLIQQWGLQGAAYYNDLNNQNAAARQVAQDRFEALMTAINGNLSHPPAGGGFTAAGWSANFGKTGANPYDVNADQIVDVKDWGILSTIFGQGFRGAA